MLVIETARNIAGEFSRLPALSRIGVGMAVVGLGLDVVLNLSPTAHAHAGHVMAMPMHHEGHLLALAAMVVVLAGVVIDALRRHRFTKEDSHAHR